MATAELTRPATRRFPSELRRAWLGAYGGIWLATLSAALTVAVIRPLRAPARELLRLRLQPNQTPAPEVCHIASLAAHNFPIAAWPVLLGVLGAHRSRLARQVADTALVVCIGVNVLPVGAALGAYGPSLLPYLPQLPFEWAGLALGASAWLLHRHQALTLPEGLAMAALTASALICAATLETIAVPHEQDGRERVRRSGVNFGGGHNGCSSDNSAGPIPKETDDDARRHGRPLSARR